MRTTEKNRPNVQSAEAKKERETNVIAGNGAGTPTNAEKDAKQPEANKNPEAERPITETEEKKPFIPVPSLESTLKIVETLHRRSIQRENLLNRINQLEAFEIALMEDSDELKNNHFQGCKLIIEDDRNRQFTTTTVGLIKLTAEFIHKACLEKLAEIEANIVFPHA